MHEDGVYQIQAEWQRIRVRCAGGLQRQFRSEAWELGAGARTGLPQKDAAGGGAHCRNRNAARWLEDDWLLRAADCAGCKQKGPTRCAPRRHHLPGKKGQSRKAGKAGRQTDRPGMAGRKGSLDRGRSGHRAVSGQRVQHRRGTAKAHRAAPGDAHGLR